MKIFSVLKIVAKAIIVKSSKARQQKQNKKVKTFTGRNYHDQTEQNVWNTLKSFI